MGWLDFDGGAAMEEVYGDEAAGQVGALPSPGYAPPPDYAGTPQDSGPPPYPEEPVFYDYGQPTTPQYDYDPYLDQGTQEPFAFDPGNTPGVPDGFYSPNNPFFFEEQDAGQYEDGSPRSSYNVAADQQYVQDGQDYVRRLNERQADNFAPDARLDPSQVRDARQTFEQVGEDGFIPYQNNFELNNLWAARENGILEQMRAEMNDPEYRPQAGGPFDYHGGENPYIVVGSEVVALPPGTQEDDPIVQMLARERLSKIKTVTEEEMQGILADEAAYLGTTPDNLAWQQLSPEAQEHFNHLVRVATNLSDNLEELYSWNQRIQAAIDPELRGYAVTSPERIRELEEQGYVVGPDGIVRPAENLREQLMAERGDFSESQAIGKDNAGIWFAPSTFLPDFIKNPINSGLEAANDALDVGIEHQVKQNFAGLTAPLQAVGYVLEQAGLQQAANAVQGATDKVNALRDFNVDAAQFGKDILVPHNVDELAIELIPGIGSAPDLMRATRAALKEMAGSPRTYGEIIDNVVTKVMDTKAMRNVVDAMSHGEEGTFRLDGFLRGMGAPKEDVDQIKRISLGFKELPTEVRAARSQGIIRQYFETGSLAPYVDNPGFADDIIALTEAGKIPVTGPIPGERGLKNALRRILSEERGSFSLDAGFRRAADDLAPHAENPFQPGDAWRKTPGRPTSMASRMSNDDLAKAAGQISPTARRTAENNVFNVRRTSPQDAGFQRAADDLAPHAQTPFQPSDAWRKPPPKGGGIRESTANLIKRLNSERGSFSLDAGFGRGADDIPDDVARLAFGDEAVTSKASLDELENAMYAASDRVASIEHNIDLDAYTPEELARAEARLAEATEDMRSAKRAYESAKSRVDLDVPLPDDVMPDRDTFASKMLDALDSGEPVGVGPVTIRPLDSINVVVETPRSSFEMPLSDWNLVDDLYDMVATEVDEAAQAGFLNGRRALELASENQKADAWAKSLDDTTLQGELEVTGHDIVRDTVEFRRAQDKGFSAPQQLQAERRLMQSAENYEALAREAMRRNMEFQRIDVEAAVQKIQRQMDELAPPTDAMARRIMDKAVSVLDDLLHGGEEGFIRVPNITNPFKRAPNAPLTAFRPGNLQLVTDKIIQDAPGVLSKTQELLSGSPMLDSVGRFFEPIQAGVEAGKRGNIIRELAMRNEAFKWIEGNRARTYIQEWLGHYKSMLGVNGKGIATKVQLKPGVTNVPKGAIGRLDDIAENIKDYDLTPEQLQAVRLLTDAMDNTGRAQKAAGVDIEWVDDYYARTVKKGPDGKKPQPGAWPGQKGTGAGHMKQRSYVSVRDGIREGFEYHNPLMALENRLVTGIDSIANADMMKGVKSLTISKVDRAKAASPALFSAKSNAGKALAAAKRTNDPALIAKAQADYDSASKLVDQAIKDTHAKWGERELYGRIVPEPVIKQIEEYFDFVNSAPTSTLNEAMALARFTMVNGDLSQMLTQGTTMLWNNPVGWLKTAGYSLTSIVKNPYGYMAAQQHLDEAMRYAAVTPPSEWLSKYAEAKGILGKTEKLLGRLPIVAQLQNSFEWFTFVGQMEMYNALRGRALREFGKIDPATGAKFLDDAQLKEVASSTRKQLGVILRPGLTKSQKTLQNVTFFAPAYRLSFAGLITDAAKFGPNETIATHEARRALGSIVMGSAALVTAASLAQGYTPNLTNPFRKDFFGIRVGDGYVYPMGPWQTWFRGGFGFAQHLAEGDFGEAAKDAAFFMRGGAGVGGAALVDFITGSSIMQDEIDLSPTGLKDYITSKVGPIGLGQVLEEGGGLPGLLTADGRRKAWEGIKDFPARSLELFGGRTTPMHQWELMAEARTHAIDELAKSGAWDADVAEAIKNSDWGDLLPGEKNAIDEWIKANNPELYEKWMAERYENDDVILQISDRADAERSTVINGGPPGTGGGYEFVFKQLMNGGDPSVVWESYDDMRNNLAGRLATLYEGAYDPVTGERVASAETLKYREFIDSLPAGDVRKILDDWYGIVSKHEIAPGTNQFDWDGIEAERIKFIKDLAAADPLLAKRFASSILSSTEIKDEQSHPLEKMKKALDTVLKPYYELPEGTSGADRVKMLASDPSMDRAAWMRFGGPVHSIDGAMLAQQSVPNRPVEIQFKAGSEPILMTPQNQPVFQKYKAQVEYLFGLDNTNLDGGDSPMTELRKADPLMDALYFWTMQNDGDKNNTAVVWNLPAVDKYLQEWGPRQDGVLPRQGKDTSGGMTYKGTNIPLEIYARDVGGLRQQLRNEGAPDALDAFFALPDAAARKAFLQQHPEVDTWLATQPKLEASTIQGAVRLAQALPDRSVYYNMGFTSVKVTPENSAFLQENANGITHLTSMQSSEVTLPDGTKSTNRTELRKSDPYYDWLSWYLGMSEVVYNINDPTFVHYYNAYGTPAGVSAPRAAKATTSKPASGGTSTPTPNLPAAGYDSTGGQFGR